MYCHVKELCYRILLLRWSAGYTPTGPVSIVRNEGWNLEIHKIYFTHNHVNCSDMILYCSTVSAAFIQKYSRMSCDTDVFSGYLGT